MPILTMENKYKQIIEEMKQNFLDLFNQNNKYSYVIMSDDVKYTSNNFEAYRLVFENEIPDIEESNKVVLFEKLNIDDTYNFKFEGDEYHIEEMFYNTKPRKLINIVNKLGFYQLISDICISDINSKINRSVEKLENILKKNGTILKKLSLDYEQCILCSGHNDEDLIEYLSSCVHSEKMWIEKYDIDRIRSIIDNIVMLNQYKQNVYNCYYNNVRKFVE